jgi:glycosyltransferase involved in cell wall biosynthesis
MSHTGGRSLSVVLPVYRNRAHLPELHRRLTAVMHSLTDRHELVFVDDAAGDGALEWLRACRDGDPHVVVVEMERNGGQHRAVRAGLRRASGDIVAVMDADLQDLPEDIPRLVQALGSDEGVVFARRLARHQSQSRHLTGLLFKRFLRRLAGSRIPAGTGMFFVASRQVVQAATSQDTDAPYVPLLFDQTGAPMMAIDVMKELRLDSPSAYSLTRRLRLALGALGQALAWRRAKRRQGRRVTNRP